LPNNAFGAGYRRLTGSAYGGKQESDQDGWKRKAQFGDSVREEHKSDKQCSYFDAGTARRKMMISII